MKCLTLHPMLFHLYKEDSRHFEFKNELIMVTLKSLGEVIKRRELFFIKRRKYIKVSMSTVFTEL